MSQSRLPSLDIRVSLPFHYRVSNILPTTFLSPSAYDNTMNDSTSWQTATDDQQQSQSANNGPSGSDDDTFQALSQYPFDSDSEYLIGLSTILGHPSVPPSSSEISENADLVLQAKCFYFARKHGYAPIDPSAYRRWLESSTSDNAAHPDAAIQAAALPTTASSDEPASTAVGADGDERPPYPTSFEAIVDLITRNAPVPGIEEIPPTVLDHGSSKVDNTPRRKKPWESGGDESTAVGVVTDATEGQSGATSERTQDVNGHLSTGEGVVKILQPNAIPESGLLSKE
jgi:hypothetical protein